MPAPRLVRASDRVAVWHEAADKPLIFDYMPDDNEPKDAEYTPDPDGGDLIPDGAGTIVGPPKGKLPAKPPAVVIPNSNKFKTPANGLKKLLDTVDADLDDKDFYGPNAHPKVQDWLDKHPAFTKTYLKPGYQDALKATLGQSNYDKLVYHAPKPSVQALTTHAQQPAPNSNKFKTPANGLSKLLHNPETTPEHVKAWVDKHPGFVSGYLQNPSYQDAVKGAIGEANYKAWADELGIPQTAKPKKTPDQKAQDIADAFAPAGFVPKTQEQFFDDHVGDAGPVGPHHNQYTDPALLEKNQPKPVQEPIQGEMSPEDQADIDAIKAEQSGFSDAGPALDDALGPPAASPPELFADWQKVFPGATAAPDQEKMQAYLSAPAGEIDPDVKAKIQAIYDKHFGQPSVPPEDQPEVDAIKQQAVAQGIKAIFPNAPGLDSMPLSAQEQLLKNWQTHLVHTPGHKDNLAKINKLYDQYFGGQAAPTAPAPDKYQDLLDKIQAIKPDWIKQKSWLEGTDKAGTLDQAMKGWTQHPGLTPEQQAAFQKLHDQFFGQSPAASEQDDFGPPVPTPLPPGAAEAVQNNSFTDFLAAHGYTSDNIPADKYDELSEKYMYLQDTAPGGDHGPLSPEDQAEADAIKAQMPAAGMTPYEPDMPHLKKIEDAQPGDVLQQAAGPLPDWLDISKDGYPDWVDTDSTDQTNSYYSWLQSWEPHDLQYWAAHPDQAQKSWQYHSAEGKWLTPEDFSKVEEGGPAEPATSRLHLWNPQQAKDDWLSIWTGDQDTWENQGLDDPLTAKAYVEAILKDKSDGNYKVPEMEAWFAKYFGSGSKQDLVPLSHDYLTQQLQAADDNVWGGNTLQDFLDSSLTEKKEKLQEMIVAGEDSLANDDGIYTQGEVNIYKKLVQQLSGQPTQQQMGPSIGQQLKKIVNDYTGTLTVSNEVADAYDAKSPADLQNVIVNIKDAYPALADKIQQAYEQHISGMAQSPTGYDPAAALAEWNTIFPNGNPTDFSSAVEAEKKVHEWQQKANEIAIPSPQLEEKKAKVQAFYDKWFGNGVPTAPAQSDDYLTEQLIKADPSYWKVNGPFLKDFLDSDTQAKIQALKGYIGMGLATKETNIYKQLLQQLEGGMAAPAPTGGYDPVAALAEWKTIFPNAKFPDKFNNPEDAKAWVYKNLNNPNANVQKKPQIQAFWDKWFGSGAVSGAAPAGYVSPGGTYFKPSVDELKALFPDNIDYAESIGSASDADFKENYDYVKGQMAAGAWKFGDDDPWTKIVKYIDSKQPSDTPAVAPPPPPLPPFDPDAFQVAYKAMFPGSGWDATQHTPEQTKAKMQEMVQTKIKNFGYNPTTQTQIDLYEKWFGPFTPSSTTTPPGPPPPPPPAPMTPDQAYAKLAADPENAKLFGSPEFKAWFMQNPAKQIAWATNPDLAAVAYEEATLPPPPPPMPFKSQPFKPDELAHWAANKPISEAGWKNFSTWWANTQVPPEQEQALYKAWFDKDTSPEQAGAWFQAMFELHAQPSEGDLGLQAGLLPNWAQSTWAFGPHAAQEWPVFQAWATKDPGIPAGTKIRQKLMIWKSLSAEEKAAIADNYLPQEPINTKGLLADLQKAFPDSNWKAWGALGQGTLKEKLRGLAETGAYPGLIPVYNKYFNGDIPMPEAAPAADKAEVKKPKQAPLMKLPDWVKDNDGYSAVDGSLFTKPGGEQRFTDFYRFADSIGKGDLALGNEGDPDGYSYPNKLLGVWNQMQPFLKARIKNMPALPWTDVESFKNWFMAQPTLKDEVEAIAPGSTNDYWDVPKSYDYARWNVSATNKSQIEKLIGSTSDPQQKQGLLHLYQKYFGVDKDGNQLPTLAESLKAIEPVPEGIKNATDWDKYLQTTPPDTVAKLIKKKLKDETDPDKFAAWCDIWAQFFPGPPGNKVLSSVLGKGHPGGKALGPSVLGRLYQWKKQGSPDYGLSYWDEDANPSAYVNKIREQRVVGASNLPLYLGWNPPGADDSDYVPDPALFGNTTGQQKSYTAPELETNKNYAQLIDGLKAFAPGVFSAHDLKKLKSDGFQNWFSRSPKAYQESYLDNPDIALDDYDEFIERGGAAYGPALPQGSGKTYDWSSYNLLPQHGDKGIDDKKMPLQLTHNPPRQNYSLEAPIIPNQQGTLPLGVGDRFAPKRAPIPIYRIIPNDVLNLDGEPRRAPRGLSPKQKEFFLQQQRARLRRIDQIINGPLAKRDSKKDREHFEQWAKDHSVTVAEMRKVEDELFSNQPTLDQDEKWKFFQDWCQEHDMPEDAMYGLASKLGIGNPGQAMPGATGSYDHPELGQLILDYVEANGLGTHWTRSPAKAYEGIPAAGASTAAGDRTPVVMVSGWWEGRGEDEGRPGGAFEPDDRSELEHSLRDADDRSTGAPVWVHRVQIRDQNGDWHDLIDPGPISLWPPGRNENVTGKNTKDKPSLAERLDYDLPGVKHDPDEWDTLVPGPATDKKFFQLFKDNGLMVGDTGLLKPDAETAKRNGWEGPVLTPNERELRDRLLKAYRQWFIGQPKLPTKPHYRTASMADSHARTAEGLYSFALRHGVRDPEKYGLPMEAATFRPSAQPRAVAYDAPRRGMEVRKPHGIVTVRERYL